MTDRPILSYRQEWYAFTTLTFPLRSFSQVSSRPWAGGNSVYGPHAQAWMPKFTAGITDESVWPDIAAFFADLGGQSGLMRIGDPSRVQCRYNRDRSPAQQMFSDGTGFTDGTGFIDGFMPPAGHLIQAAERGATFLKLGGLLPDTLGALNANDLIEIRPNGVADQIPRLHAIVRRGNTNADGETGVQITPPLRAGVAAGDMAVLEDARSVFHVADDMQGDMEISPPLFASFGFSLIEAIENV